MMAHACRWGWFVEGCVVCAGVFAGSIAHAQIQPADPASWPSFAVTFTHTTTGAKFQRVYAPTLPPNQEWFVNDPFVHEQSRFIADRIRARTTGTAMRTAGHSRSIASASKTCSTTQIVF